MKPAPRLNGRIEVRNAGFRYYPNAPWALRNVSFSVQPGQKIAIVGRTGSGKSTLALLLLGLHELDEGEILYDGNPLASMDYRSLRSQFGVVLQTPSLFSGSIRRNIAAHDPELPLDAIVQAAQLAVVHDEIMAMPMGYDTVIAEGGVDLAGGQRQRIAIARALAHDPAILALDEATSNLDAITESIVDQNLSGLECTRIVIAHRLSTVRNADLILVLDAGVIVERGTHEDLLALGGVYAQPRSRSRYDARIGRSDPATPWSSSQVAHKEECLCCTTRSSEPGRTGISGFHERGRAVATAGKPGWRDRTDRR